MQSRQIFILIFANFLDHLVPHFLHPCLDPFKPLIPLAHFSFPYKWVQEYLPIRASQKSKRSPWPNESRMMRPQCYIISLLGTGAKLLIRLFKKDFRKLDDEIKEPGVSDDCARDWTVLVERMGLRNGLFLHVTPIKSEDALVSFSLTDPFDCWLLWEPFSMIAVD